MDLTTLLLAITYGVILYFLVLALYTALMLRASLKIQKAMLKDLENDAPAFDDYVMGAMRLQDPNN